MAGGRLMFPFLIEIDQLDLSGTAADSDGAGPLTSGYDPIFRETRILSSANKLGTSARAENLIQIPGQFGNPQSMSMLMEAQTGNLSPTEFEILFHYRDIERLGLIETSTGSAKIKVGDRLNAIYQICDGSLIQKIRNPPGCFITKASPTFGLHSRRNLLICTFRSRDPGTM